MELRKQGLIKSQLLVDLGMEKQISDLARFVLHHAVRLLCLPSSSSNTKIKSGYFSFSFSTILCDFGISFGFG